MDETSAWVPATHVGDLSRDLGFLLQMGLHLAIVVIWRVNQQSEDTSLSLTAFQINK